MGSNLDALYPSLEAIEDAAEAVTALMRSPGYDVLRHLIGAEIVEEERRLEGRHVLEHTDYVAGHNRKAGLRRVESLMTELISRCEKRLSEARAKYEIDGAESPSRG